MISRFKVSGRQPHDLFRGYEFQGALGRMPVGPDQDSAFGIMGFSEMAPYEANAVTLDSRKKDSLGIQAPRIRCKPTTREVAQLEEQVKVVREIVDACGYRVNFSGSLLGLDSTDVWPDADPISRLVFRAGFKSEPRDRRRHP